MLDTYLIALIILIGISALTIFFYILIRQDASSKGMELLPYLNSQLNKNVQAPEEIEA